VIFLPPSVSPDVRFFYESCFFLDVRGACDRDRNASVPS